MVIISGTIARLPGIAPPVTIITSTMASTGVAIVATIVSGDGSGVIIEGIAITVNRTTGFGSNTETDGTVGSCSAPMQGAGQPSGRAA